MFVNALLAKFIATIATYPMQVIQTRHHTMPLSRSKKKKSSVSLTQLLLGHLGTSGRHWMGGVRRPYTEWYTYVPIFSKNIFESCIVIDDTWYRHDDTRIISHLFREA
jgi:hypothetical protein